MLKNVAEILQKHAQQCPTQTAYTFLQKGETIETCWDYQTLDKRARQIAYWLQQHHAPQSRILLLYPPGLDFIASFLGCLYADMIAIPAYPPEVGRFHRSLPRLFAILRDADCHQILSVKPIIHLWDMTIRQNQIQTWLRSLPLGLDKWPILGRWFGNNAHEELSHTPDTSELWIATEDIIHCDPLPTDKMNTIEPDHIALIQYTSGSTGTPKGVVLTHGQILANQDMICKAFQHHSKTILLGWLPFYHDMGLIGNILQPLYLGVPCILMSPISFLQKPERWLQAISQYHATTSGGPNFAFELCTRKIPDHILDQLDLSSWEVAFNGSETVRAHTLHCFAERFQKCGFKISAFLPCYGLAEASLIVAGTKQTDNPKCMTFDTAKLENRIVQLANPEPRISTTPEPQTTTLVGHGQAVHATTIVIVNPETKQPCAQNQVGEIWVQSPSIALQYWNNPTASFETFHATLDGYTGTFLRTGDLGFFCAQELFIAGRIKDMIILHGRNLYPQDLEATLEQFHTELRPGCGCAFTISEDEEQLAIVYELRHGFNKLHIQNLLIAMRQTLVEEHQIAPAHIVLIADHTILKTSSGKIQRKACRQALLEKKLTIIAQQTWQTGMLIEQTASSEPLVNAPTLDTLPTSEPLVNAPTLESPQLTPLAAEPLVNAPTLDTPHAKFLQALRAVLGQNFIIKPENKLSYYGIDSVAFIQLQQQFQDNCGIIFELSELLECTLEQLEQKFMADQIHPNSESLSNTQSNSSSESLSNTQSNSTPESLNQSAVTKSSQQPLITFPPLLDYSSEQEKITPNRFPASLQQYSIFAQETQKQQQNSFLTMYTIARIFDIQGELDIESCRTAWLLLYCRHTSLHTGFMFQDGKLWQVVTHADMPQISIESAYEFREPEHISTTWHNASQKLQTQNKLQAQQKASAWIAQQMSYVLDKLKDLEHPPLFHVALLQRGQYHYEMFLAIHHLLADFHGLEILWREWKILYHALRTNHQNIASALSLLPLIHATPLDFVTWQNNWLTSKSGQRARQFWDEYLPQDLPILDLPADHRSASSNCPGKYFSFCLPTALYEQLQAMANQQNTTLYTVMLTGLTILLYRYTHQTQILIGSPCLNRPKPEFQNLVAHCMNTLPIVADVKPNITGQELLLKMHKSVLAVLSHSHFPTSLLGEIRCIPHHKHYSPLFQVFFTFQQLLDTSEEDLIPISLRDRSQNITWDGLQISYSTANHANIEQAIADLNLVIARYQNKLLCAWHYAQDFFQDTSIQNLTKNWITLLNDWVAHPDKKLEELQLVSASKNEELQLVSASKNYDIKSYSLQNCCAENKTSFVPIAQRIFEQAHHTPDKIAVRYQNFSFTYSQVLNLSKILAEQLALLLSRKVQDETIIAIYLERGWEIIIAILSTLNIKSAYLPLDPHFPISRLAYMLQSSHAKVIITTHKLWEKNSSQLLTSAGIQNIICVCMDKVAEINQALQNVQPDENIQPDKNILSQNNSDKPDNTARQNLSDNPDQQDLPENFFADVHPQQLAYLLYTSGSSGYPKGVAVTQLGLTNALVSLQTDLQINESDIFVAVTTLSFDIAMLELLLPLLAGATVVIATQDETHDPEQLKILLIKTNATVLQATPLTWKMLIQSGWRDEYKLTSQSQAENLVQSQAENLVQTRANNLVQSRAENLVQSQAENLVQTRANNLVQSRAENLVQSQAENLVQKQFKVFCGGEPLDYDLYQALVERQTTVYNLYGPTETTIWSSFAKLDQTVHIGQAIANTQIYIVDSLLQIVPVGVYGEIVIAGDGLAHGYHNLASLTAQSFVPNPFSSQPGSRMYRTGDYGRYKSDGTLEIQGRRDHQVKIRGYRIELGEIESAVRQNSKIRDVAVVINATQDTPILAGYVVLHNKPRTESQLEPSRESPHEPHTESPHDLHTESPHEFAQNLHQQLTQILPNYMIPNYWEILSELPRTNNNKLDRKALAYRPILSQNKIIEHDAVCTSSTDQETKFAGVLTVVWSALLHRSFIPRDADFFDIGGHSILAMQLTAEIESTFQLKMSLADIFHYPRFTDMLAEILRRKNAQQNFSDTAETQPHHNTITYEQKNVETQTHHDTITYKQKNVETQTHHEKKNLRMSYGQQQIWFWSQLANSSAYHISGGFQIRGEFNHHALECAWLDLVKQNEVLCSYFPNISGTPQCKIADTIPQAIRFISLVHLASSQQQIQLQKIQHEHHETPFDLGQAPLWRFQLVQLADDLHILLITLHHIIADGWSLNLIQQELSARYQEHCQQKIAPTLPKDTSHDKILPTEQKDTSHEKIVPAHFTYADFAEWQYSYWQGEKLAKELEYWKQQLMGDIPQLNLPYDFQHPNTPFFQAGQVQIFIADDEYQQIIKFCRDHHATLFMLLTTAYSAILHRYTDQTELLLAMPTAERTVSGYQNILGFFVNTLLLRINIKNDPSFEEFFECVRETMLSAYQHSEIPFDLVLQAIKPERRSSASSIFQVMINGLDFDENNFQLHDLQVQALPELTTQAKFELTLYVREQQDSIGLQIRYAQDLFMPTTVARMLEQLRQLLLSGTRKPHTRLSQLSLQSPQQLAEQLAEFNDHLFHPLKFYSATRPAGNSAPVNNFTTWPADDSATQSVNDSATLPNPTVKLHGIHILDWLKESFQQYADCIAIEWRGQQITYQQLHYFSQQISQAMLTYLQPQPPSFNSMPIQMSGKDSLPYTICQSTEIAQQDWSNRIIVVLMENKIAFIASMLAIFQTKCIFAPLNAEFPSARLSAILAKISPVCILTEQKLESLARNLNDMANTHAHIILSDQYLTSLPSPQQSAPLIAQSLVTPQSAVPLETSASPLIAQSLITPQSAVPLETSAPPFIAPPLVTPQSTSPLETSAPPLIAPPSTDWPCYLYFTSGSTGQPKGILGKISGLSHFIRWEIETLPVYKGTRIAQVTLPHVDVMLRDVFTTLCVGGKICVPDHETDVLDIPKLCQFLTSQHVQILHCVPSLWSAILAINPKTLDQLTDLQFVLMAGEILRIDDVKKTYQLFHDQVQLYNLYGATETNLVKCSHCVTRVDIQRGFIPAGKPMSGVRMMIVDQYGKPCAPGLIGEIYTRTPYLSLGYYHDTELTRQTFLQNPFQAIADSPTNVQTIVNALNNVQTIADSPNNVQTIANAPNNLVKHSDDIVYRTGDLGRMLGDDCYCFLGRKDQQVKIHGLRVLPSEVESLLCQYPGIAQAVVLQPDPSAFLVAFIVLQEPSAQKNISSESAPQIKSAQKNISGESAPQIESAQKNISSESAPQTNVSRWDVVQVRQFLKQQLPYYMIPSDWIILPQLPRLAGGKLDHAKLISQYQTQRQAMSQNLQATTPTTQNLQSTISTSQNLQVTTPTSQNLQSTSQSVQCTSTEPPTNLELALCQIWSQVLGRPVNRHDNFFDLGGHSLMITRVLAMVQEIFEIQVSIPMFFQYPTIHQLAQVMEKKSNAPENLQAIAQVFLEMLDNPDCQPK